MKTWILAGAIMIASQTVVAEPYKEITIVELSTLFNKQEFLLLDARDKANFNEYNMIPGAKWLPFDSNDQKISEMLPDKSKKIVIYCCDKECGASEQLAKKLESMGYTDVSYMPEGCKEWFKNFGKKIQDGVNSFRDQNRSNSNK